MEIIYTSSAPEPVGPYSQAILAGNTLYCSGQIGINPKTNALVEGVENQTEQIMKNISEVLKKADMDFSNVVKTTCFLDDIGDFTKFNEIYAKYFISKPARSCVQAKLPKGAKAEIEIIAVR
jgi:2-iminobutanoate/2-iminopropanoate deaminase